MSDPRFLYVDDEGAVQGPFGSTDLLQWHSDGYFRADTPLWPAPAGMADEAALLAEGQRAREAGEFKPFVAFFPQIAKAATAAEAGKEETVAAQTSAVETVANTSAAAQAAEPQAAETAASAPAVVEAAAAVPAVSAAQSASSAVSAASSASPAAPPAPSPAPSAAPSQWHYLDDAGVERGPFPASDMAQWYAAGFFGPHTKARTAAETTCRPLSERGPDEETFVPAAAAAAPATAAAAPNIEDEFETDMDQMIDDAAPAATGDEKEGTADEEGDDDEKEGAEDDAKSQGGEQEAKSPSDAAAGKSAKPEELRWYYVDASGVEQGPFSAASMLRWHRAGFFAFNDSPLRRSDEFRSTPLSLRTSAPSFFTAVIPRRENRWYYLDAQGEEQGPFTEVQMRQWWDAKYLKPSLRVRQVGEDEDAFSPIESRDCAFTKPPAPMPAPAAPLLPSHPVPPAHHHPHPAYYAPHPYGQYPPQQPGAYPAPPPPVHYPNPYAPVAPAYPYAGGGGHPAYAAAAGGYAGYAAYDGSGGYGGGYGAGGPAPPRAAPYGGGDYAQSMAFSGHRGRGRHVVGAAYGAPRGPHDPLSGYVAPEQLDNWANKRPRH